MVHLFASFQNSFFLFFKFCQFSPEILICFLLFACIFFFIQVSLLYTLFSSISLFCGIFTLYFQSLFFSSTNSDVLFIMLYLFPQPVPTVLHTSVGTSNNPHHLNPTWYCFIGFSQLLIYLFWKLSFTLSFFISLLSSISFSFSSPFLVLYRLQKRLTYKLLPYDLVSPLPTLS